MKKLLVSAAVVCLLGSATVAALAQGYGGMMSQNSPGWMTEMRHMNTARMEHRVSRHLGELKETLKITPAQESAWAAFVAAMAPTRPALDKLPQRAELDKLTTPERIDKMRGVRQQHLADMSAAMDKRDEATKALYVLLSPEQQKLFDSTHRRLNR